MSLLLEIATYISEKTSLVLGENVFYFEAPDEPDICVYMREIKSNVSIPAQIDASIHRILFTIRNTDNEKAEALANKCYRWMLTEDPTYDVDRYMADTNGFIRMPNSSYIFVELLGTPVWDNVDQQGRKYFCFEAIITTQK